MIKIFYKLNYIVLLVIFILVENEITKLYLLVTLLGLICAFPLVFEKKIKFHNPIFIITFYTFITYGISAIFVINYHELNLLNISIQSFIDSTIYAIMCTIFFLSGFYYIKYIKSRKRNLNKQNSLVPKLNKYDLDLTKIRQIFIWVLVIGWSARVILFLSGAYYHVKFDGALPSNNFLFESFSQILTVLMILPNVFIIIMAYMAIRTKRKSYKLLLVLSSLIEVIYWLPSGGRENIIILFFVLFMVYSIHYKINYKWVSIGFLIIFLIFPLVDIYRTMAFGDLTSSFQLLQFMFNHNPIATLFESTKFIIGVRLNYITILSVIMTRTPEVWGFLHGSTYIDFFTQLIPRFIWPTKPRIMIAGEFGRDFGITYPGDYETSVGMTWFGEMFLNFGWYGIIVALFIGLIIGIIYFYFFKHDKPNLLYSIFYIFIIYNMIRLESIFSAQASGTLKFIIILTIVLFPFIVKSKNKLKKINEMSNKIE